MQYRLVVVVTVAALALGACTTAGGTPATAPPIIEAPTTSSTSTTTTMPRTTTTLDRLSEIQAIFQDLEVRRLQAIMDNDEEAFRAVFANEEYAERSVGGMELVTVMDPESVLFTVLEVFVDDSECIVVAAVQDGTNAILGAGVEPVTDYVIENADDGWGYSWIGSGWRCDRPHPFSG